MYSRVLNCISWLYKIKKHTVEIKDLELVKFGKKECLYIQKAQYKYTKNYFWSKGYLERAQASHGTVFEKERV